MHEYDIPGSVHTMPPRLCGLGQSSVHLYCPGSRAGATYVGYNAFPACRYPPAGRDAPEGFNEFSASRELGRVRHDDPLTHDIRYNRYFTPCDHGGCCGACDGNI
jgi:hypothetical protein